ncbi:alpha-ketoacid dehydrogenase subunit beta [Jiangella anatolica]|uniref:Alpha-ketoacid dehydrogenase subunit beta n=1 Tax=Jiangella anatolica TaxID=2670374 RepID=A0A2W2B0I3_9ACTN|nr:pyruvate dehydrogenase complex E1 component subunit beta [Jiangella anatolica]PZF79542.1 alpha-ketoacid dehydrogenase subunit beta [Jiangella anatolica]
MSAEKFTENALNYRQTIARSIHDAMQADPSVFFFGEDIGAAGGPFKTTAGLFDVFGPHRVRDTPISEQAIVGAAIGAAAMGQRPIAEIMFADFAAVAHDQIVNQLAKYRYMTGGQVRLPVTLRLSNGAGSGFAAQHSQPVENWYIGVPGLKVVAPGTVEDLYGLMQAAVRDDDPVLVFEHKTLFSVKGTVTPGAVVPIGSAAVVRSGGDVTIVAAQLMRHRAVEAAARLDDEGIHCTVIDPRTLVPFDDETVLASLRETSRLVVVGEGPADGSWGAALVARVARHGFELLDAAPRLVCSPFTPVPYAESLERAWLPSVDDIVAEVRSVVAY